MRDASECGGGECLTRELWFSLRERQIKRCVACPTAFEVKRIIKKELFSFGSQGMSRGLGCRKVLTWSQISLCVKCTHRSRQPLLVLVFVPLPLLTNYPHSSESSDDRKQEFDPGAQKDVRSVGLGENVLKYRPYKSLHKCRLCSGVRTLLFQKFERLYSCLKWLLAFTKFKFANIHTGIVRKDTWKRHSNNFFRWILEEQRHVIADKSWKRGLVDGNKSSKFSLLIIREASKANKHPWLWIHPGMWIGSCRTKVR